MSATHTLASFWPGAAASHRWSDERWSYRAAQAALFCSLWSIIFLPEFVRDSSAPLSPIYSKAVASFRFVDLLLLALAAAHLVAFGCMRHKRITLLRRLAIPGAAFLGCIALAIGYGARHGGNNFFFDWRGLALGIALYFVWSFWLQRPCDVAAAMRAFLAYMGFRIAFIYLLYIFGQGESLLGVSIPLFDGPLLSTIVFCGLLAFACLQDTRTMRNKLLLASLAIAAYLLVLLCLRRTYWGELALGTAILLLLRQRHRLRNAAIALASIALAAAVLGSSFSGRLSSLDVSRGDTEFSADNQDHLYDLVDAWSQVRQSPVMGIGLGTSYRTWHIRNWKHESVMVHNAPLHVWLKYGLAGLICYLWFHLALLKWLHGRARASTSPNAGFLGAAFAYLTAQFVMTLGFAPWPYSELQLTVLISFLLAAAVAANIPAALPARRLSHNV